MKIRMCVSPAALAALALVLGLGACSKAADPPRTGVAPPAVPAVSAASVSAGRAPVAAPAGASRAATAAHAENGIAWRDASSDADVDAAFALARAEAKPVFLYWGAAWCPPCNQVKATIFNRQDFIERSRAFVAVYVDGDSPGAQKLGARFHVSGYPTMLLFNAEGVELTRLPGEVDPARYTEVVTLGMNARRPVKAVLADALAGGRGLGADDWRLLAFYSWDTDEQQLAPRRALPAMLQRLAAACPTAQADTAMRLRLKALAASETGRPRDPAAVARIVGLLGDATAARAQFDVLANSPVEITRALSAPGTAPRARLVDAFDRALARFQADASLSRADRIGALIGRLDLAQIDIPKAERSGAQGAGATRLPIAPALLADVRAQADRADREIIDGYERQAVITAAAYMLGRAGLMDESDALLQRNLARSHAPYYLMTELAENATQRGDRAAALRWHREAWEQSVGPATRLQWGARYVAALVDLAPRDEDRIESAARQVLAEAAAQPNVFYERSSHALRRISTRLRDWNRGGAHAAALRRLDAQLARICTRLDGADGQRATCKALLEPGSKPRA